MTSFSPCLVLLIGPSEVLYLKCYNLYIMKSYYKLFSSLILSLFAFPALADVLPLPDHPRPYILNLTDAADLGVTVILYFLATLLFELPVMYLFSFRSRRSISAVAIANFISVFVLQISLAYGFSWLMMEMAVVLIEFAVIKFMLKDTPWKKLLLAVFVANLFSAVIGTLALASLFSIS